MNVTDQAIPTTLFNITQYENDFNTFNSFLDTAYNYHKTHGILPLQSSTFLDETTGMIRKTLENFDVFYKSIVGNLPLYLQLQNSLEILKNKSNWVRQKWIALKKQFDDCLLMQRSGLNSFFLFFTLIFNSQFLRSFFTQKYIQRLHLWWTLPLYLPLVKTQP